jgi:predicted dehydrogenase
VALVACADPVEENAQRLAGEVGVPRTYRDHREMLAKERPDIVSVCVWTALHLPLIRDAVEGGAKAIHAEKPMAPTWGDAKAIYALAKDNGVMMTFCHQRRFGAQFVKARDLANNGAIGEVLRYEGYCPNMFDWGTHWFDMFFFYNNDEPAESVLGQVYVSEPRSAFGVPMENQGVSVVFFKNGRCGLLLTGISGGGCANRIIGAGGVLEVGAPNAPVRMLRSSSTAGWETPDLSDVQPRGNDTVLSVLDLIACLKSGDEPRLSVRKALQATELIFATYESSRSRSRVDLPLQTEDNAFLSMLDQGTIGPGRNR